MHRYYTCNAGRVVGVPFLRIAGMTLGATGCSGRSRGAASSGEETLGIQPALT